MRFRPLLDHSPGQLPRRQLLRRENLNGQLLQNLRRIVVTGFRRINPHLESAAGA